jgi:hypothetical protein
MVVGLIGGRLAAVARADGDPASDVLVSQPLFLPQDAGVAANRQAELASLLTTAGRRGYPIRVALIDSTADLGSVTALWRQPQNYARFLGQELALVYHGPLLVVMPDGFGFYRPNGANAAERSVLARLPTPRRDLATSTIAAIEQLAAASGHVLPIQAAAPATAAGSSDKLQWLVFAIGLALIVLASAASLRARPLRTRDGSG